MTIPVIMELGGAIGRVIAPIIANYVTETVEKTIEKIPDIGDEIEKRAEKATKGAVLRILDDVSKLLGELLEIPADERARFLSFIAGKGILTTFAVLLAIPAIIVFYFVGAVAAAQELARQKSNELMRPTIPDLVYLITELFKKPEKAGIIEEYLNKLGFSDRAKDIVISASKKILSEADILSLFRIKEIDEGRATTEMKKIGVDEDYIHLFKKLIRRFPDTPEIFAMMFRGILTQDEAKEYIEKLGFTKADTDKLEQIAWYIPPPADLVRFAVREVFTPAIVEKYMLYEDFPEEFAKWSEKVGMTREWAKNYWAGHWELPSLTMGYEMLHRGIITKEELDVLMRTLDIMPYWRDKLIELSYVPFTRVDVRRMYKAGVLDEKEVFRAYQDIGYDEFKAMKMTEFTIKDTIDEERDFTKSEILGFYTEKLLTKEETIKYLTDMKYTSTEAGMLIAREDTKIARKEREMNKKYVKVMFKRRKIDEIEARSELARFGITPREIDILILEWQKEAKVEEKDLTKEDIMLMYKKGIIPDKECFRRLKGIGYDDEEANLLTRLAAAR